MRYQITAVFILIIFLASGCSNSTSSGDVVSDGSQEEQKCPDCNDNNPCTLDSCSEKTDYKCSYTAKTPCCGNKACETGENYENCPADCVFLLDNSTQKIVDSQKKVNSYTYTPLGDLDYAKVSVMGEKIKIKVTSKRKHELFEKYKKWYDTVLIDRSMKLAYLVCEDLSCDERNILDSADYDEFPVVTPFDMIKNIKYTSNKLTTETVETFPCAVIEAEFFDRAKGKVWLSTYYGFPHRILKNGQKTEYTSVDINSLIDIGIP